MKNEFDFDSVGRKLPYQVPEGFFESLTEKTLDNIKEREQIKAKKNTLLRRYIISASSIAATVVATIMIGKLSNFGTADKQALADFRAEQAIDLALESMSDTEMDELAILIEYDMFYSDNTY